MRVVLMLKQHYLKHLDKGGRARGCKEGRGVESGTGQGQADSLRLLCFALLSFARLLLLLCLPDVIMRTA